MSEHEDSRRDFIKRAAYVVPTVLSLNLVLAKASAGSGGSPPRSRKPADPLERRDMRNKRDLAR